MFLYEDDLLVEGKKKCILLDFIDFSSVKHTELKDMVNGIYFS